MEIIIDFVIFRAHSMDHCLKDVVIFVIPAYWAYKSYINRSKMVVLYLAYVGGEHGVLGQS